MKKYIAICVLVLCGTPVVSKDLADIDVGDRVCWTGILSDSYGHVTDKYYSSDSVRMRLDNGSHHTVPAADISSVFFCKMLDEGRKQFADWLLTPSETDDQN